MHLLTYLLTYLLYILR